MFLPKFFPEELAELWVLLQTPSVPRKPMKYQKYSLLVNS
jgi:hypothetical protein